jgi:hypothetical protein
MDEKIEKLVLDLRSDSRFMILKDRRPCGFWSDFGLTYNEYTELESDNLKILYVKDVVGGVDYSNEITITNKKEDVYAFCNSSFRNSIFNNKLIINKKFHVDELKDYIEKNV